MSLKDLWTDKVDGIDDILSKDINDIAHAVIEIEEKNNNQIYNVANALIGTKKGQVVAINDISPISQSIGIKVESEYVTNISSVKVKRYGKNLFPPEAKDLNNYTQIENNRYVLPFDLPVGKYFFSVNNSVESVTGMYFYIYEAQIGTEEWVVCNYLIQAKYRPANAIITIKEGYKYRYWCTGNLEGFSTVFTEPQIEYGETATSYEPYIEPIIYSVSDDGIVKDVLSIYPSMTLATDTSGTMIEVEYSRDINKAFAEIYNAIISLGGNI